MLDRYALALGVGWQAIYRDLLSRTKPGVTALLVFTAVATARAARLETPVSSLLALALADGLAAAGAG